jgi:ligand-binding sensor domain-containing protein/serine phosphatase RsbU (regulator of sigma subunit)
MTAFKPFYKIFLSIIVIILGLNEIWSQSPHFKNYILSKGKRNLTVNTIFQDKFGYMWFGTSDGLFRFNGINYLKYTVEQNLADNFVTAINQDNQKQIWIGHKNGKISILKNNSIRLFKKLDSLISEPISCIRFSENTVWIGTQGNGLFRVDSTSIKKYDSESSVGDDYIYDIEIDKSGNLWIGSDIGIIQYNYKTDKWRNFSMKNGLPDNIIKDIEFDSEGKIWLGMEDLGIAFLNPEDFNISIIPMWKFGQINHIVVRNKGEIWISTRDNGIIRLIYSNSNSYGYKKFSTQNGLIDKETFSVFKDSERNVWIGARSGISLFTGDLFEFLTTNEGLPSNEVFSFIIDKELNYWVCSKIGLYKLTKSVTGEFNSEKMLDLPGFTNHTYTSVYEDSKGYIWVGTYGYGVYRFDPGSEVYKWYSTKNGLTNNNIISISGKDNLVWLSTFGGGVNYCDISSGNLLFENINSKQGLLSNYVYSTFTDSKNIVWFAKDGGGIAYRENGHIKTFKASDSISNVIYGITEDFEGSKWFITSNHGILKYDGKTFSYFTQSDNLISKSYQSLISDNYGNCIFSSNEGISIYDKNSGTFQNYTDEDGVGYMEPNLNSVFKGKDGVIWIGTNQGIIKYNPLVKQEQKVFPKISIISRKAFDIEMLDSTMDLDYTQNHLEFGYIGLWYKNSEKLIYRYKLEGHDLDWSFETKSLIATYSGLPPGKFKFIVQVSYEPGNWTNAQTAEFIFQISPPFWKRAWFIIVFIIATIAFIYSIFRIRLAGLERAKKRLELEVIRRTAEIERQRDEIEIKNRNITDSILYASRIQTALLPLDEDLNDGLSDYFVLFKPRDIVSGDYYWMSKKNDEIVIVAADCTGHGVPGAFMSMLGVAFLNEIVNQTNQLVACNILNELRINVKKSLRQSGKKDEAKDGMDIALCILNQNNKHLQFAGAYNPLYLVREGKLIQFKADRMPIGIYYKEKESFTNHVVELKSNDVIYLFSDGYVDQFGGKDGKKFLIKQFQDLILRIHQEPLDKQKQILIDTLDNWKGKHDQVDDILVIGFRIQ